MPDHPVGADFLQPLGKPRKDVGPGTESSSCPGCARRIVANLVVCGTCRAHLSLETRRYLWDRGKRGEAAYRAAVRELLSRPMTTGGQEGV